MTTSNLDLQKIKKIHFIGIGGIGISAIAHMMLRQGEIVSGSDLAESPITHALAAAGADIWIGQSAERIRGLCADSTENFLVIYTVAIQDDNPELAEARRLGIQTLTYPKMLSIISREKFTIAVAGSHGKTTTTAMIAKILSDAGFDPTVIVGSLMKGSGTNFQIGRSRYFVVEACEYKESFLNLCPSIAVITNVDDDHLDYYGNIDGVKRGFEKFAALLPASGIFDSNYNSVTGRNKGTLVCNPQGENMPNFRDSVAICDYSQIADSDIPTLKIPGEHNIKNAKAALAVARLLGVKETTARRSLENFSGTWRRFELLGKTKAGRLVYDDYAHHPTEIRATLQTLRRLFPDKKITLVFQPHLYSRTKEHLEDFAHCFAGVDILIIAPIYAAREPNDPSINSEILAEKIKNAGFFAGDVQALASFEAIESKLMADEKEMFLPHKDANDDSASGDILMTMGAGNINEVALAMLQ